MKVVHIESGLGNQMLSYCELLSLRSVCPDDDYYIENLVYSFKDASNVISQWQGYELEKVFGIKEKNVRELFNDTQWIEILKDIQNSRFWDKEWNWPVYFTNAFEEQGLVLKNMRGDFEVNKARGRKTLKGKLRKNIFYKQMQKTFIFSNLRRWYNARKPCRENDLEYLFYAGNDDILTGQKLSFMYINNNIEKIDEEIRKSFSFPPITDAKNLSFSKKIKESQSVAIHARRGDLLGLTERYYVGGYFKRAVKYIKTYVKDPVFCFFCDPGSIDWCRENGKIFSLDFAKDKIMFVDWNSGENSYRDMQLMSLCKHNIITISSFGWWGAYLNRNKNKITISPEPHINTKFHM